MTNTSVNKKTKKQSFTSDDFTVTTPEELLTASYGKKGTLKRTQAEKRIQALSKKLSNA